MSEILIQLSAFECSAVVRLPIREDGASAHGLEEAMRVCCDGFLSVWAAAGAYAAEGDEAEAAGDDEA